MPAFPLVDANEPDRLHFLKATLNVPHVHSHRLSKLQHRRKRPLTGFPPERGDQEVQRELRCVQPKLFVSLDNHVRRNTVSSVDQRLTPFLDERLIYGRLCLGLDLRSHTLLTLNNMLGVWECWPL